MTETPHLIEPRDMIEPTGVIETQDPRPVQIDLYWRPGCGFCAGLQRGLDRLGIERVEHNIWDDPADAAIVRRYANGNETIPTVVVDGIGLVNPSPKELLALLAERAPHLLPAA